MSRQANRLEILCVLSALFVATACAEESDAVWQIAMQDGAAGANSAAALQQQSQTSIKDASFKNDVVPILEFRCLPGDPGVTARIDWKRFISSFSTEAGFKVDDGRFTWLKWKIDQSENVTISPSAEDSSKLIDLLVAGDQLLVEISPYSEGPVTAQFSLAGLDEELAALRSLCQ